MTHFADNVDSASIQHIKKSGSQTISSVFSQPAPTWKNVLDTFGWHGNRQLFHQPAALWCHTVMTKLRNQKKKKKQERKGKKRQKREGGSELETVLNLI